MKLIYAGRLETGRQFVEAIKLPYHIVAELVQMAVDRMLLRTLGMRDSSSPLDLAYTFTEEGKRWTLDALERLRYVGPAPVALDDFTYRVNLQKLTNELVTFERIRDGLGDLTFDDSILEQCGPALNSGRAMLLYGPPGNGKTSVAHALGSIFNDVIYVPYAISVEGQIIRYHDPSIHIPINPTQIRDEGEASFIRAADFDARWVPCRRPFVVTGGELTLEMLDLRYDADRTLLRGSSARQGARRLFHHRRLRPPDREPEKPAQPLDRSARRPRRLSQPPYRQKLRDPVRRARHLLNQPRTGRPDGPGLPASPALQDRSGRAFT